MRRILKLGNRLRRSFFSFFNQDYIKDKLKDRRGSCIMCGKCCKGCKHLDEHNKCKVYEKRPVYCHQLFPIDKMDQKVFGVTDCGYYFQDKNHK